jgi:rubrerythrin
MSEGRESLILQLLNKDVNESLLNELEKDFGVVPEYYAHSTLKNRIGHFNRFKKILINIFDPSSGIENRVDDIEEFFEKYLRPKIKFTKTMDVYTCPFDKDELLSDTESFVERIIGEAFYSLARNIKVYNVLTCDHCSKYYFATRKDARFCSITCKRQADFKKHKNKYYRTFLERRKDGKYLPINNIHCIKCRTSIPIPKHSNGKVRKSIESIQCPNCNTINPNPWASQKRKDR